MKPSVLCIIVLLLGCQLRSAESTDLLNVIQTGDLTATQTLADSRNADIGAKNEDGWDSLMFATEHGHVEIVKFLLSRGADPNTKENDRGNRCFDKKCTSGQLLSGRPVLTTAVQRGQPDIVRLLIEAGADVSGRDSHGYTALRSAWQPDIVQMLLDKGADPNGAGQDRTSLFAELGSNTPLMIAAHGGNIDVLRLLLKAGADPNARGFLERSALHEAAEFGFTQVIQPLVAAGAAIDTRDLKGTTALMIAAERGRVEFVKVLLAARADPDATDKQGQTALIRATLLGQTAIVQLLKDAGSREDDELTVD
jgi:uncharacterized protein